MLPLGGRNKLTRLLGRQLVPRQFAHRARDPHGRDRGHQLLEAGGHSRTSRTDRCCRSASAASTVAAASPRSLPDTAACRSTSTSTGILSTICSKISAPTPVTATTSPPL